MAYLRMVPPVRNAPPPSRYKIPLPPVWGAAGIPEGALKAIIACLRSLPPIKNKALPPEPPKKP